MPDDLRQRGKPDRDRINLSEPYEVRHWCAEFGIDERQLRLYVQNYGVMVAAVRAQIAADRRSGRLK